MPSNILLVDYDSKLGLIKAYCVNCGFVMSNYFGAEKIDEYTYEVKCNRCGYRMRFAWRDGTLEVLQYR